MRVYIALAFLLLSIPAYAQAIYFPQIVNGPLGGGTYQTIITLSNPGQDTVTGTLKFYKSGGNPWSLTVNGNTNTQFNFSIPASGSTRFTTSGTGDIATGWASAEPSGIISGVATYEIRSGGTLDESVGVLGTKPTVRFAVPMERDSESTMGVGIALANVGSSPVTVNLSLRNEAGQVIQTSTDADYQGIPAHGYVAKYASQAFPSMPASFKGDLVGEVSGAGAVAVVGLILKSGVQSAVPVTDFTPALYKEITGWFEFYFSLGDSDYDEYYFIGYPQAPSALYAEVPGAIWGSSEWPDPVYAYWDEAKDSWIMVYPWWGWDTEEVFEFHFTGADTVAGCYYLHDLGEPLGDCTPLTGDFFID